MANTLQSSLVLAKNMGHSNVPKGVVLAAVATYTIPATVTPTADDVIQMVPVFDNMRILDVVFKSDDTEANMDVSVGDGSDTDRFIADIQCDNPIVESMLVNGPTTGTGINYSYTAEDTIDILFDTAAPNVGATFTVIVFYQMNE